MMRTAAVVVLYHPSSDFIEKMRSYIGEVDILFAVDNSESVRPELVAKMKSYDKVVYHAHGYNAGIAAALNTGAQLAIEAQCDQILLLDQDSTVSAEMVKGLKECSGSAPGKVGIIYARHVYKNYPQLHRQNNIEPVLTADTSGSLLNLAAYRDVGGFADELFIDYVDFEYCLRLRTKGYEILQLNTVALVQQLGNMTSRKFLFWTIGLSNHSAVRVYYRVRNRLAVAWKYKRTFPRWSIAQMLYTVVEVVKIVFYEKDKLSKIKMMALGIIHFFTHKLGSIRHF